MIQAVSGTAVVPDACGIKGPNGASVMERLARVRRGASVFGNDALARPVITDRTAIGRTGTAGPLFPGNATGGAANLSVAG